MSAVIAVGSRVRAAMPKPPTARLVPPSSHTATTTLQSAGGGNADQLSGAGLLRWEEMMEKMHEGTKQLFLGNLTVSPPTQASVCIQA